MNAQAIIIVNADDLGHDVATSDAILAAHQAKAVTSASAMVFMADSQRAAGGSLAAGLPVGLHLNLTEPFDGVGCSAAARETQARLARVFDAGLQRLRWTYDPRLARDVYDAVDAQLSEFRRLYGQRPTHVDGHRHVHACLNLLWSRALIRDLPVRRVIFDDQHAQGPRLVGARARQAFADRRFRCTDHLIRLSAALESPLASGSWEVMTHPGDPSDLRALRSDAWSDVLSRYTPASYADWHA